MECQGCKKIPTGARDNTDKLKYRWIFHPELFNAMNGRGQVGTNLWHFVAYSRLCHIFHNESLHIAVPRQTKTDEYRKLIKRGDSNATFRPLKQLIAGSELFSGLLQAVIQSLTPIGSKTAQKVDGFEITEYLPSPPLPLPPPPPVRQTCAMLLIDGRAVKASDVLASQEDATTTVRKQWMSRQLWLRNHVSGELWRGVAIQEEDSIQHKGVLRVFKLDQDSGDILRCLVSMPQNSNDTTIKCFWFAISEEVFLEAQRASGYRAPSNLLDNFDSDLQQLSIGNGAGSGQGERLFEWLAFLQTTLTCFPNQSRDAVFLEEKQGEVVTLVHLKGAHPCTLQVKPYNRLSVPIHMSVATRKSTSLAVNNSAQSAMTAAEVEDFTALLIAKVNSKTLLDLASSSSQKSNNTALSRSRVLYPHDDTAASWQRYFATKISMKQAQEIGKMQIRLLHSEGAWHRFQGQICDMKTRGLCSTPQIMFHGVRGIDTKATTQSIAKLGFRDEYAKTCAFGQGIYFALDFACALKYVQFPVGTSNMQNRMLMCLVLPGDVAFNGQQNEKLPIGKDSWCKLFLDCGTKVFATSANAALPIAELIFS